MSSRTTATRTEAVKALDLARQLQALFNALDALAHVIHPNAHASCVFVRVCEIAAQPSEANLQQTDASDDLFELAPDALLASLEALQVLKDQVFIRLGHAALPSTGASKGSSLCSMDL